MTESATTAHASLTSDEFNGVFNVDLLRRQADSSDHQIRSANNNDTPAKKREDDDDAIYAMDFEGNDDAVEFGQALPCDEDTRRMKITFAVNNHQLFYSDRTKVSDSFLSRHGSLEVYDQTQENGARNGSPGVNMNQESYGLPLSDSVTGRMLRSINQPQQDETWDSLEYTSSSLVDMPKYASLTSKKRRRPALSDRHYDVDPGTRVSERQIGDQSAHQVVGMDTVDVVPTMVIQGDPVAENHDLDVHFECTEQTSGIVEPEAQGEACSNRPRAALASASCAMRGQPQRSAHSRKSQVVEQNPHLMMNLLLMAICTDFQCSVLNVLLVESEIDPDATDVAFNAEPKTHTEALRHPAADEWVAGEEEEIGSFYSTQTWAEVDIPEGANLMKSKWVYREKKDDTGTTTVHRSRLVCCGYSQIHGVDYDEVFAPVIRHSTFRLILALSAHYGLYLRHLDIPKAFPQADLDFDCYMRAPPGYPLPKGKCYKLLKALYGTKQAARQWNLLLSGYFISIGLTQCESDLCLYYSFSEDGIIIICLYVDDIVIAASTLALYDKIYDHLHKRFRANSLGELRWFLGMQIVQSADRHTISINQRQYILKILDTLAFQEIPVSAIPMRSGTKLSIDQCPKTESEERAMVSVPYKTAIGMLIFLMICTRPELAFSVSSVARFMKNPGIAHWEAVQVICGYLRNTMDLCLTYKRQPDQKHPVLYGYCDADWASNDIDTRKSISGIVFMMSGGPIAWKSQLQKSLALSTMESEYYAMGDAAKEAKSLRLVYNEVNRFLEDEDLHQPTTIHGDGQSAMDLSNNPVQPRRSRHIDLKHHFIRVLVGDGVIKFVKIASSDNLADIFTKPLSKLQFQRLRDILLGLVG